MTEQSNTSAINGTKVPKGRKLLSFREFMEATRAGQHPEKRPEQTKTAVQGSKRAKTVLRSADDLLVFRSGAGKSR